MYIYLHYENLQKASAWQCYNLAGWCVYYWLVGWQTGQSQAWDLQQPVSCIDVIKQHTQRAGVIALHKALYQLRISWLSTAHFHFHLYDHLLLLCRCCSVISLGKWLFNIYMYAINKAVKVIYQEILKLLMLYKKYPLLM